MPRGPGKKANYDLDYSRFDSLDDGDGECEANVSSAPEESSNDPSFAEVMSRVPAELREAQRLMAIARESGDPAAEQRASELALKAVEKGDPEVKRTFMRHVAEHMPEVAEQVGKQVNEPVNKVGSEDLSTQISRLRKEMEFGAESAREQMENLRKQQEQFEKMQSPEDIMKFMHEGGFGTEDMQRIFSGDGEHMERCVKSMLEKTAPERKLANPEAAIRAAEALHGTVCGNGQTVDAASTACAEPALKTPLMSAAKPEAKIPAYRLQYLRGDGGEYSAVEFTCQLPGVSDMAGIVLDVSERHIRLNTVPPSPPYVANAGPFPVLISPDAARAKFSKKREELTLTVPSKKK